MATTETSGAQAPTTADDAVVVGAAEHGLCACGCGGALPVRPSFLQGHDARLRGVLVRAARAEQPVVVRTPQSGAPDERLTSGPALLDEHGWPQPAAPKGKAPADEAPADEPGDDAEPEPQPAPAAPRKRSRSKRPAA